MPGPLLYSCNPHYSTIVADRYRNGKHYVWCSESFSSAAQGTNIAASSDPVTIYTQLVRAVQTEDHHDTRLKGYRKTFKGLAAAWFDKGEITQAQYDEIFGAVKRASFRMWRPVLYLIPRAPIELTGRLKLVPAAKRAAAGEEFIIGDLSAGEFDVIELPI
jgi:hypothetical protein